MKRTDNVFFEIYKKLDAALGERFSCEGGISRYIELMEEKTAEGQKKVNTWDEDIKMLKQIRWARNKIAHETSDEQVSEQAHMDFVKNFYMRVSKGKDPLALIEKTKVKKTNKKGLAALLIVLAVLIVLFVILKFCFKVI